MPGSRRGWSESRGSPDDVDGNEPTEYDTLEATLGFAGRRNRISLSVGER
jgi:hypothetical protein